MPEQKFLTNLDVAGTVDLSNLTIDGAQGADGQVLTSTSFGIAWEDASGGASLSGGEANKVAIWSATDTLTHNDNFHFDTTNVRLGIGTSSPYAKLHIKETSNSGSAGYLLQVQSVNGGGDYFNTSGFHRDSSQNMRLSLNRNTQINGNTVLINSSGNSYLVGGDLGIGTYSPGEKLDVNGNIRLAQYGYIYFGSNSSNQMSLSNSLSGSQITQSGSGSLELQSASNDIHLKAGGLTKAVVRASGKVGIGTTTPDSMLHLKSTGDVKLILEADSDNSGENDNPLIELKQDNSGIIGRLGMVGDAGQLFTNSRTNSTGLGTVYQQDLIFFTENSARVYIKGESGYQGRVGIGTATPSHPLHITGTGLASSSFRAPIFYDSNDTNYYVDPSSTSQVNNVTMNGELILDSYGGTTKFIAGSGDAANYTNQNVILSGWNGLGFYNPTSGGSYTNQTTAFYDFRNGIFSVKGSHRAPVFYDSDNTDYYVNPSASGVSLHINGIIDQDFQVTDLNSAWTAPGTSRDQGFIVGRYQGNASNRPHHNDNANWFANIYSHASGGTASYGIQLAGSNAASGENSLSLRTVSNGSFSSWRKVFHEGHTPTAAEVGAAASSHNHAASDITSGTFATARIPSLDASKITSGTFSDLFANSTRYNFGLIDGNSSQTRDKLRVWNSSSYTIGMKSGFTFGHLNDYAMSFQMNNDNDRGWWWGDDAHTDAQGAMSLTTNGKLTVATSLSIGQGESITSASTVPLFVDGTAVFDTTSNTEPVCISRSGSTSTEVLKIGVTDTIATFNYIEDTSSEGTGNFGRYDFILGGNSSETSVTPLILEKTKTTSNAGAFTFGTPGNGSNTLGRWLSFEGNADSSGEGSGRLFFSEHNSSTTDMDDYGMSIGYRGGSASVTTAGGNTWTGLSAIGNGQWGMWGHNNSLAGSLIMSGDRNATYVNFNGNNITNVGDLTATGLFIGGTGAANELDDYEEGTYNLKWSLGGSATYDGNTQNFGSLYQNTSKYVKIGRVVHIFLKFEFNSHPSNWASSGSYVYLTNLPFTPLSGSVGGNFSMQWNSDISSSEQIKDYGGAGHFGHNGSISTSLIQLGVSGRYSFGYYSGWSNSGSLLANDFPGASPGGANAMVGHIMYYTNS